jgi:hypothetical protein
MYENRIIKPVKHCKKIKKGKERNRGGGKKFICYLLWGFRATLGKTK